MADHYQEESAGDPRLAGDEGELYIDKMKRRVNEDFTSAREFMRSVHSQSVTAKEWYFNALRYEDMKKNDKFPVGFYQRTIDAFVAYIMDKLFYKGRPCTLTGVEESDKRDADVKQNMLDWQDRQDKIYRTTELCLKDAAMARIGVVEIDYVEETERRVVGIQEPEIATDNDPDSPTFGEELETGRMVSRTEVQDFPVYKGPKVKRIDPCDFFVTQDKTKDNDGEVIPWNENPENVREEVLRRNAKAGYCNRDGSSVSAGKGDVYWPVNKKKYGKNYEKIFRNS